MTAPARRGLIIGRFQPFHLGHLQAITRALDACDRLILGIGSAQESHTLTNPFTAGERYRMIEGSFEEAGLASRVAIVPIPDLNRNALWVRHVESLLPPFEVLFTNNALPARLFREAGYDVRAIPLIERTRYEGTRLRDLLRENSPEWEKLVPDATRRVLKDIDASARLRDLAGTDKPRA